jgi:Rrf2 family protein
MRISKKSEYALRSLLVFARNPRSYQIQELSRMEKIPIKFLEQILLTLRHAGLLDSKRGVGGGYVMRVPANQITVGKVIQIMDGPLSPVPCAAVNPSEQCTCPDPRTCALRLFMTQVREKLSTILEERTIEDLMRMGPDAAGLAFDI